MTPDALHSDLLLALMMGCGERSKEVIRQDKTVQKTAEDLLDGLKQDPIIEAGLEPD